MPAPPCGDYGDVTGNGDVNMGDVILVHNHLMDPVKYPLTEDQKKRADVTGNGKISYGDEIAIKNYVYGYVDTFSVCGQLPEHLVSFVVPTGTTLKVVGVEVI